MDDLQGQIEIGRQAEEFLKYTWDYPYFNNLLERITKEFERQILELSPSQKDAFSNLMTGKIAMTTFIETVRSDIYLASEALKQLEGVKEPGGLL